MKKQYTTPAMAVVCLHHQQHLLAGSSSPTKVGNDLIWSEPAPIEEFLSDEEIA